MVINIKLKSTSAERVASSLSGRGFKTTRQRDSIVRIFAAAGQHLSAEELYELVKKAEPGIGYATVYRTLRLLSESGLAHESRFEDGFTRYELSDSGSHHDHIICTGCGQIIEFENHEIEKIQQAIARKHHFLVTNHKHEIYGLCSSCQRKPQKE
ncbi:MAG: transcriptional repressor [Nitrospirota bacterium]|nr:transcriptional repressor [Nitrospirota bacterium]